LRAFTENVNIKMSGKKIRHMDSSFYGEQDSFKSEEFREFSEFNIEMMFQPLTIRRYIESVINLQKVEGCEFFPLSEEFVKIFFSEIKSDFDYNLIKYHSCSDLDIICQIISYIGKSGYNYIKSAENVLPLNQPVLIFYGMEQLSAYFASMHFNFTVENTKIDPIRNIFHHHGLDPWEFNKIDINSSIDEILNKKLKLLTRGAAQRFFFTLGFPLHQYFFEKREYSLFDLIHIFFTKLQIGISNKTEGEYRTDFSIDREIQIEYHEDLNMFIFYTLSFLFSHLSRYKIFTWQKLMESNEKNLGLYLQFLMNKIKSFFIRKLFSILEFEKTRIWMFSKHAKRRDLFRQRWENFLQDD
jgi:hypothetical protein